MGQTSKTRALHSFSPYFHPSTHYGSEVRKEREKICVTHARTFVADESDALDVSFFRRCNRSAADFFFFRPTGNGGVKRRWRKGSKNSPLRGKGLSDQSRDILFSRGNR